MVGVCVHPNVQSSSTLDSTLQSSNIAKENVEDECAKAPLEFSESDIQFTNSEKDEHAELALDSEASNEPKHPMGTDKNADVIPEELKSSEVEEKKTEQPVLKKDVQNSEKLELSAKKHIPDRRANEEKDFDFSIPIEKSNKTLTESSLKGSEEKPEHRLIENKVLETEAAHIDQTIVPQQQHDSFMHKDSSSELKEKASNIIKLAEDVVPEDEKISETMSDQIKDDKNSSEKINEDVATDLIREKTQEMSSSAPNLSNLDQNKDTVTFALPATPNELQLTEENTSATCENVNIEISHTKQDDVSKLTIENQEPTFEKESMPKLVEIPVLTTLTPKIPSEIGKSSSVENY